MAPKYPLIVASSLVLVLLSGTALSGQILSNGTGGGEWTDGATWLDGSPPASNQLWAVEAGDTVSATGVSDTSRQRDIVRGTLNINTGTELQVDRLNNGDDSSTGLVNINSGGILDIGRFSGSGDVTINVNSGGSFISSSILNNGLTLNVNSGGTATVGRAGGTQNIFGGTMILAGDYTAPSSWTTGTLVTNTFRAAKTGTEMGDFLSALNSNGANVLQISNQATAQTFSVGRTNQSIPFEATAGIFEFRAYSDADNDSDLMRSVVPDDTETTDLSLSSAVQLRLISEGSLPGTVNDYLGSSYQLFLDNSGTYGNITPTLQEVIWDIGGSLYNVEFIDNLSVDGTLVVDSLSVIPEPATAVAIAGLVGLLVAWTRRRQ